MNSNFWL